MPREDYDVQGAEAELDEDYSYVDPDDEGSDDDGGAAPPPITQAQAPDDRYKELDEKINAIGGMMSQMYGNNRQQQYQPQQPENYEQNQRQPTRYVHDLEFEQVRNEVNELRSLKQDVHESFKATQSERFNQSLRSLEAKYGEEFGEIITPQDRQRVLGNFLADADRLSKKELEDRYGFQRLGWERQLETAYRDKAFDRLRQQKNDELGTKREEKSRSAKAAARIPSGGSVHQTPKSQKLDPARRGYTDAARAAKAEFEAMFGG